ncbi:hypothetical protein A0H81_00809 [Grifola frondosa]|uniref:Arrestin C-terminal-like domain-containing protein n=1 Tax=Grifola frondosa TaxID=5627 RepID=A0A1C7MRQ7_GRIFR|nr:hypothetical protein A0H81_00809 [Grifola frondosa]
MQGLLSAETGGAMVELDFDGSITGSAFREGQHIALDPITPGGSSTNSQARMDRQLSQDSAFSRHDSLFSFGTSPSKNAAELKSLLGNANSRLKPGATVVPLLGDPLDKDARKAHAVSLEQAKARARVEVDIVLESNTCVQGGYLRGHIKVRVRKRSKKESPLLLAEGKVRVIGFECIPNEDDRHTFYQCAAPLSAVTDASSSLYKSPPDGEGFSQAMEGVHVLPFAMHLAPDCAFGMPKGVVSMHSGVSVRYIAMISVKVKDSTTGKRSIAHFYRSCEIWPRLNSTVVLARAPRPLQASAAKSLSMLSSAHKVKLTALLHRLTWVAGQRCYVRVSVANDTKKTAKSLVLTLVRTTTVFKPKPALDPGLCRSVDPDACQTSTTHKVVAETMLEMGHGVAKGHASAKGWWTGVGPGQELEFSHFILLPPDALSITRGRLLEVEYSVRVTLSAGSLTSDVHVTLPIRIINFLSIDPIPSEPLLSSDGSYARFIRRRRSIDGDGIPPPPSPVIESAQEAYQGTQDMDTTSLSPPRDRSADVPSFAFHRQDSTRSSVLHIANPDRSPSPVPFASASASEYSIYSFDSESQPPSASSSMDGLAPTRGLGNLDLDDPDSDEEVDFVVGSARLDYDDMSAFDSNRPAPDQYGSWASTGGRRPVGPRLEDRQERGRPTCPVARPLNRRGGSTGMTPFALRVQEKLAAIQAGAPASCDTDATPRLGCAAEMTYQRPEPASIPMSESASSVAGSQMRASRQLPRPPMSSSRSSVCGLPASQSAFESMMNGGGLHGHGSTGAIYPSASFPTSSSIQLEERPTEGMHNTGSSTSSVAGRIAAFEERMKHAQ